MRVGIVSGYFNPIHTGHLDYLEGARQECDMLYVIVNNDHQVALKGSKQFMDDNARLRIVNALSCVDKAMVSVDKDGTVVRSIAQIHKRYADDPFMTGIYFMNGGDRKEGNVPEYEVCEKLNIEMRFGVGGSDKPQSSSWLVNKAMEQLNGTEE